MLKSVQEKFNKIPLEVKVSSAYAICSILQKCLSFITLPLFTRILTKEQYGQYTIYSSWMGILTIFLTLNLAYGSFQTAMMKYEKKRDEYIASIQGICLVLTSVFLVAYLIFHDFINKLFELPSAFVFLMASEIIFSTATQLWMGKNRFEYKYKSVIFVTLITAILSPLLAFLLVYFAEEKGYARIIGYACVNIIIGIVIFTRNIRRGKVLYNKEYWKYAFAFNVPLLAYYLSQVIFNQSDRIMISHMVGTGEAAMYGVAHNLAMVLIFVLNAINASYVPWFYGRLKEGKSSENKIVSIVLLILMGFLIMAVIWFAPEIVLILAGAKYKESIYVVAPIAMSLFLLFYSQLFINVEFFYEEKRKLVYGSVGAAILNIILNYVLIPEFGFVSAGYATLASYMLFAVSNLVTMKSVLRNKGIVDDLYEYKWLLIIFIIFIAVGFIGMALYANLAVRIIVTGIVVIFVLVFKARFINVLKMIKGGK